MGHDIFRKAIVSVLENSSEVKYLPARNIGVVKAANGTIHLVSWRKQFATGVLSSISKKEIPDFRKVLGTVDSNKRFAEPRLANENFAVSATGAKSLPDFGRNSVMTSIVTPG